MAEGLDWLHFAIFQYRKSVFAEIGDHLPVFVHDGHVERYFIHLLLENKATGVGRRLISLRAG